MSRDCRGKGDAHLQPAEALAHHLREQLHEECLHHEFPRGSLFFRLAEDFKDEPNNTVPHRTVLGEAAARAGRAAGEDLDTGGVLSVPARRPEQTRLELDIAQHERLVAVGVGDAMHLIRPEHENIAARESAVRALDAVVAAPGENITDFKIRMFMGKIRTMAERCRRAADAYPVSLSRQKHHLKGLCPLHSILLSPSRKNRNIV